MSQSVISVADVCFRYGEQEVLHNVSFEVPERAFVAVVGPNGGGKTTLLRLIMGALTPRFGEVRVFGQPPASALRRIGYVPQHLLFDPSFPISVRDAVLVGRAAAHRVGRFTAAERLAAEKALERVGLAGLGQRHFAALSGGQRQRVLIAQAPVSDPSLLLFDEPTANVDTSTEQGIYTLLRELNQEATVVVVSHNLSVVTAYASHVLCVNRTAGLHTIGDLTSESTQALPESPHLAMVRHSLHCHVLTPGNCIHEPHRAAPNE